MNSWISAERQAACMASIGVSSETPRMMFSLIVPWKRVGSWATREMFLR